MRRRRNPILIPGVTWDIPAPDVTLQPGNAQVTVFVSNVARADAIYIYRDTQLVATLTTTTTFTDRGVQNGTLYAYTARTLVNGRLGPFSDAKTATPQGGATNYAFPPPGSNFNPTKRMPLKVAAHLVPGYERNVSSLNNYADYLQGLGYTGMIPHGLQMDAGDVGGPGEGWNRQLVEYWREIGMAACFEVDDKTRTTWYMSHHGMGHYVQNKPGTVSSGSVVLTPHDLNVPSVQSWNKTGSATNSGNGVRLSANDGEVRINIQCQPSSLIRLRYNVANVSGAEWLQAVWFFGGDADAYQEEYSNADGTIDRLIIVGPDETNFDMVFRARRRYGGNGSGVWDVTNVLIEDVSHEVLNIKDNDSLKVIRDSDSANVTSQCTPNYQLDLTGNAPNYPDLRKGLIPTTLPNGTDVTVSFDSHVSNRVDNNGRFIVSLDLRPEAVQAFIDTYITPLTNAYGNHADAWLFRCDERRQGVCTSAYCLENGFTVHTAFKRYLEVMTAAVEAPFPGAVGCFYGDMISPNFYNHQPFYSAKWGGPRQGIDRADILATFNNARGIVWIEWNYDRNDNRNVISGAHYPFDDIGDVWGAGLGNYDTNVQVWWDLQGPRALDGQVWCAWVHNYSNRPDAINNPGVFFNPVEDGKPVFGVGDTAGPSVTLDVTPTPGATITSTQEYHYSVTAEDPSGIRQVRFYKNSASAANLLKEENFAPYDYRVSYRSENNGSRTVMVEVEDNAGNITTAYYDPVTINIAANSGPVTARRNTAFNPSSPTIGHPDEPASGYRQMTVAEKADYDHLLNVYDNLQNWTNTYYGWDPNSARAYNVYRVVSKQAMAMLLVYRLTRDPRILQKLDNTLQIIWSHTVDKWPDNSNYGYIRLLDRYNALHDKRYYAILNETGALAFIYECCLLFKDNTDMSVTPYTRRSIETTTALVSNGNTNSPGGEWDFGGYDTRYHPLPPLQPKTETTFADRIERYRWYGENNVLGKLRRWSKNAFGTYPMVPRIGSHAAIMRSRLWYLSSVLAEDATATAQAEQRIRDLKQTDIRRTTVNGKDCTTWFRNFDFEVQQPDLRFGGPTVYKPLIELSAIHLAQLGVGGFDDAFFERLTNMTTELVWYKVDPTSRDVFGEQDRTGTLYDGTGSWSAPTIPPDQVATGNFPGYTEDHRTMNECIQVLAYRGGTMKQLADEQWAAWPATSGNGARRYYSLSMAAGQFLGKVGRISPPPGTQ